MTASGLKKGFVYQQDNSDCGAACLLTVIRYYKGEQSLEKLRELSGTGLTGTTLLGLYQCANKVGFVAKAFIAEKEHLKTIEVPCILHVVIENLQHFIVLYCVEVGNCGPIYLIGDPARGIIRISEPELEEIWKSKTVLVLKPDSSFITSKEHKKIKTRWFVDLLREDLSTLLVTMIIGLFVTILGLAMAVFSQKLIDNILPAGHIQKLINSLVLLFLILLIRAGLSYIRQRFLLLQSKDFNNRILTDFYSKLIRLPKSFFDRRKTGDMIARMNDTARIQRSVAFITGTVFIDIVILITTSIFLINYSTRISVIVFVFIPLLVLFVLNYTKPLKIQQHKVMSASAMNESSYIDTIQGISVIKSNNTEFFFINRIRLLYGSFQNENLKLGEIGNKFTIVTDLMSVSLNIVLIGTASFMVLHKQLKTGEMIAILSLANTLIPAVGRLSQINMQLQEANIAFDRMYDFTSIEPEYQPSESCFPVPDFYTLSVENISFNFPGRKTIIKNISFELLRGEVITLLGESGSGKSTIISILQKFYSVNSGSIKLNDILISEIDTSVWRNLIAVVPQEIKLFNGTLLDNICIINSRNEAVPIIEFCTRLGFHHYFEQFPQQYFTLIGEDGVNLSGGQKQLVAIARALYRQPQILLLDEATSAMDRLTEKFIFAMLEKMKAKMGIVLITHKAQIAKLSDRIYIIENGNINDSGIPSILLTRENFYSQLVADTIS